MKIFIAISVLTSLFFTTTVFAQSVDFKDISIDRQIEIAKAEDERRYDKTLEDFMKHPNPLLRKRAALAAGRIGDEEAVPMLAGLLAKDTNDVRQMAAFALGEIESVKGTYAVLKALTNFKDSEIVRSKAIEAAGKIAAANSDDGRAKTLAKAILDNLEFEANRRSRPSSDVILHGITAALRARPDGADVTLAKFLTYSDWRIRADALNTLARLRAKNVEAQAKELLVKDEHPIVRANAARILGMAEDKAVKELILNAALTDRDMRVRINAIRALTLSKDTAIAEKLLIRAERLFADYKKSKYKNPFEENELLTITTVLGNILKGTDNKNAVKFLEEFSLAENLTSPEVEVALVRISPMSYIDKKLPKDTDWKGEIGLMTALGEIANLKEEDKNYKTLQNGAKAMLTIYLMKSTQGKEKVSKSFPAVLNAYAKFKPANLQEILRKSLKFEDVIIRSTAANFLGDIEAKDEKEWMAIYKELAAALYEAKDDKLNDASLAMLDALEKQYKKRPALKVKFPFMTPFIYGIKSPDYLIRRKAAGIYKGFNIPKPDPMTVGDPSFKPFEIPKGINALRFWEAADKDGAKSRVIRADYKKALARKNGEWAAVFKTEKGSFTIDFFPEEAPLTVDNFINLAQSDYFNGLAIHRVVPNFVMQDGDPRGDGSGGPGWQIRCEINQLQYKRGMVGMALSGKDTGGSQWFITHSPQPHLDGGYTIFGEVNENDMKIVDNLARGDKIIDVVILRKAKDINVKNDKPLF